MIDGTEKPKILLKFANPQRDTTNLAISVVNREKWGRERNAQSSPWLCEFHQSYFWTN